MSLDLGGEQAANRPTDVRLESVRKGRADPQLAALFFQYGRYLLIAGSRADSPLPMHLQGIWNDNLACNMCWTCDFHLDINTQQNYWPTEVCNLSECGEPLFRLIESLPEPGRRTARVTYWHRPGVGVPCVHQRLGIHRAGVGNGLRAARGGRRMGRHAPVGALPV